MAFCTSCGATVDAAARTCPACSKPITGAAPAAPAAQPKSSTLKVVLIILGSLMLIGVLMVAGLAAVGFYIAKNTRVQQGSEGAKVETPFGTVEANQEDPAKVMEKLGIEVYPGARPLPGSASVNLGGMHTASAMFETDDPPEKVEEFYRRELPGSTVSTQRDGAGSRTAIMVGDKEKWTTITIEGHEGGSKIVIAAVDSGKK